MTQQHIEGRTKMEVDDTLKELGQYFGGTFVDSFENTNNNKGCRLVTRRRRQSQRVKDQECQADEEGEESEGAKIKPKFIHKKKVLLQDPKTVKNGDSSQPFWRPFQGQNPAQDQAQMKMTAKDKANWIKGIREAEQKMRECMVKNQEREDSLKAKPVLGCGPMQPLEIPALQPIAHWSNYYCQ